MKCFLTLLSLWFWVVPLVSRGAEPPLVELTVMGTDHAVSNLAMSEDGQWLITLHEAEHLVGVVDVATGKLKKQFRCREPSFALCRDGKLFVANRHQGSISVYSLATWEMLDRIRVDGDDLFYLAAPAAEHFKNQILVKNCRRNPQNGYEQQMEVLLVDVAAGTNRRLYERQKENFAVDHDGKYVFFFAGASGCCDYADYIRGDKEKSWKKGGVPKAPDNWYMRQLGDSPFWVYGPQELSGGCSGTVCSGVPPVSTGFSYGMFILPDSQGTYAYMIGGDVVCVINPETGCTEIARRKLAPSNKLLGGFSDGLVDLAGQSCAVHCKDDVHLFLLRRLEMNFAAGEVYHVVLPGILAGGGAKDSRIPHFAFVGIPVAARAFKEPVSDAALVNGPEGATLTQDGLLKWTPAQPGIHNFKVRATIDGKMAFQRFSIEVIVKPIKDAK